MPTQFLSLPRMSQGVDRCVVRAVRLAAKGAGVPIAGFDLLDPNWTGTNGIAAPLGPHFASSQSNLKSEKPTFDKEQDKPGATKIVLSYRQSDSAWAAPRIFDRLTAHYGQGAAFMDIDSIPFGTDYREFINMVLLESDILIVVVGLNWLGIRDHGPSRILEETDPVRIEVETALKRSIPIIPVLVDQATVPAVTDLPNSLKEFAFRNAAEVHASREFGQQMERLIRSVNRILAERTKKAEPG